jgi:hypothetical protein
MNDTKLCGMSEKEYIDTWNLITIIAISGEVIKELQLNDKSRKKVK